MGGGGDNEPARGRRVAVVGSGIAGLGSAWLLHRAGWEVTLYESEATCGGHTLTDETEAGCPVDLGFQVFNFTNYPHLTQLFEELGVESEESEMSFSLSVDDGRLEWASHGLGSVFAQRSNMASPSFLRMLADMVRFNSKALGVLDNAAYRDVSVRDYLAKHWFSDVFADTYLLPMCAAIWSVPGSSCLDFPIQTVVAFMNNHHMLDIIARPQWRVVRGRSRTYAERIVAELPDVRTSTPVTRIVRDPAAPKRGGVTVHDAKGGASTFDTLVMATHTDVSLKILGASASKEEQQLLKAIPYQDNEIYLHKDTTLMPKSRDAWASWNVLSRSGGGSAPGAAKADAAGETPVCVTYWVNSLQRIEDGNRAHL
jgi:predicted NAD/FAD-binding protein